MRLPEYSPASFLWLKEVLHDMKSHHLMKKIGPVLLVIMGNILYACTVKFFLIPADLISSGTTGISLVVNHFTGLDMSVFILCFNIFMLLIALLILGKKFALTTIMSSVLYPLFLSLLNNLVGDFRITDNTLLNVLFSGMGLGISLGTVLRQGASTGGMDIPPIILQKFFHIPVAVSLYVFDFIIILSQMSYHEPEDLLYGILLLMTTSITLDKMLVLGTSRSEVKIVSRYYEQIRLAILNELDRGVTILYGRSGYLGKNTEIVISVVSNREIYKIQKLVKDIDPEYFMTVTRVSEVIGRGFSLDKKYR